MRRLFRVKIDLDRLRSHLAPQSRAKVDDSQLRRWLERSGFRPQGEWWVVQEADLGQLAPSEVAEAQPVQ